MHRIIPVTLAAAFLGSGFGAARVWMPQHRDSGRIMVVSVTGSPSGAAVTEGEIHALEKKAAREALKREACSLPLTLAGLLEAARKEPALRTEAVLLEALRPLGAGQWAEFFEALDEKPDSPEGAEVLRRALLRLWAADDPLGALRGLSAHSPQYMSVAESEIVMGEVTARGWDFASGAMKDLRGRKAPQGWSLVIGDSLSPCWLNTPASTRSARPQSRSI